MKVFDRHQIAVKKIQKKVGGVAFRTGPFDIMDKEGNFYEVKCPRKRKGRHLSECRISISDDEYKFGLLNEKLIYFILFDGKEYVVPFNDLRRRIERNRLDSHIWGNVVRLRRQVTLGQKFLSHYTSF